MLGKLWKQDMKATGRLFIPAILIFLVILVLNKVSWELNMMDGMTNLWLNILTSLATVFYVIAIIGLLTVTYVFLVIHFYKTMAGGPAYLTHTLPVKTSSLLVSKLLNAVFWQIICCLVVMASFFLLAAGHFEIGFFSDVWDSFTHVLKNIYGAPLFLFLMAMCTLSTFVFIPIRFYLAIAIGQMTNKHKVLAAVLAYIGIYIVLNILSSVGFLNYNLHFMSMAETMDFEGREVMVVMDYLNTAGVFYLVYSVLLNTGFFLLSNFLFKRKLNLQ